MKILALSDIHGSYKAMLEIVAANLSVDVIVIAGDLTTHGTTDETNKALEQLHAFAKPVFAVAGNMDPLCVEDALYARGISVNGRGIVVDSVGFFGVSAAPISPLRTPNEITEEEIALLADLGWKDVANATRRVFIPHSPPINTKLDVIHSGQHVGSTAVREFIERSQPDVVICGHIHEARGIDALGNCRIVNCGQAGKGYYAVITLGEEIEVRIRP